MFADFKILGFQNSELKILADFKILALQNPEIKIQEPKQTKVNQT